MDEFRFHCKSGCEKMYLQKYKSDRKNKYFGPIPISLAVQCKCIAPSQEAFPSFTFASTWPIIQFWMYLFSILITYIFSGNAWTKEQQNAY